MTVPPSQDKSKIEGLKDSLYSRNSPDIRSKRKMRVSEEIDTDLPTAWERQPEPIEEEPVLNTKYVDKSMSFFTKLLIGSALFCMAAVGIGAYIFLNGANLISADNIDVVIDGPISVAGGEVVPFEIKIKNNNNIELKSVEMNVEFPDGTIDPSNSSKELNSYKEEIGGMKPGGTYSKDLSAILYGEENVPKEIKVIITYGVTGSTGMFTKTKSYELLLNSSPITVTVSSFKEVSSGQDFELKLEFKSNTSETLRNVMVKAEYPFGYTYLNSTIEPLPGNATWKIGDIPAGSTKELKIKGKILGEDSDSRSFRFSVGAEKTTDPNQIGTQFTKAEHTLSITKPFISLSLNIDGDQSLNDSVGQFNRVKRVEINWYNNLPVSVSNAEISVKLSGNSYDKTMVEPDLGVFHSENDTIVWNQRTTPELANIRAGGSGTISFAVTPVDKSTATNHIVNPVISITAGVKGNRAQESRVPEQVTAAVARNIKVSSNISLSGRIVRSIGPFENIGPIPPKAERTTSYTVVWTVDNTTSTVGGAVVKTTLPAYVKWMGNVSPNNEDVVFNNNTGELTWNIGNLSTYTLSSARRRELSFQIAFRPGINLADQSPILVNQSVLTAVDNYTGAKLESTQDYLTTRFSTDPSYKSGDETVGK